MCIYNNVFYFFYQNDPETLLRCLTMCAELLKQMNIKTQIGPTMSALMSSLVKACAAISFMLMFLRMYTNFRF